MIFILLRKLTDSSEDVFTNIKFQTLFCHSSAVVSFYSYILKKKKFHRWIKLLTFEPLSLKIISTSKILPNCCKEREKVTWKLDNFNSSIIYNTKVCFRKCCKALQMLNDINPNILNTKRKTTLKGDRSILFLNCVYCIILLITITPQRNLKLSEDPAREERTLNWEDREVQVPNFCIFQKRWRTLVTFALQE